MIQPLKTSGSESDVVMTYLYAYLNLRSFRYCPDVNKKALCSGEGEGLFVLVKHFLTKDTFGKPSQNYPILKEPRVWRLFDLGDDATNASRPVAVQAQHQSVLVCRHYFLVSVILRVLINLVSLVSQELISRKSEPVEIARHQLQGTVRKTFEYQSCVQGVERNS